ncbi:CesT family type III secretion system chaperone [Haliovirga abyssi]|uniref:YbjN domain-containing protein n=1 Tax=Haliovirga abyssi TaxID=2996794 RepID=A0AAU9DIR1_9FUSO|nr:CesT family type III secretion system chaperone [Haliovirga abyssi]BDU49677.1 hypothetical protein HLVA_02460 [Haliovirga abyssi]
MVKIRKVEEKNLEEVLLENGYLVEKKEGIYFVKFKEFDAKAVMLEEGETLFVQVDLVGVDDLHNDVALYKKLLDLNTEILPVSIAIDSTDKGNQRLVINESLEIENLDENELLKVFDTIDMSFGKIFNLLKEYKK